MTYTLDKVHATGTLCVANKVPSECPARLEAWAAAARAGPCRGSAAALRSRRAASWPPARLRAKSWSWAWRSGRLALHAALERH